MTLERAEPGRLAPLACRAGGTAADAPAPRAALAESIAAALLATQPAPQPVLPWRWRLGLVGAVLSVGLLGYAWKGSMAGWHPAPPPNPAEAMVQRLADRIAAAPDSAQPAEWAMLGRSLTVLGRQAEAIAAQDRQALARLGKAAAPEAAGWRVDLADLLGSAKSGSLAGEPAELVAQALAQDDRHPKALALAEPPHGKRGSMNRPGGTGVVSWR